MANAVAAISEILETSQSAHAALEMNSQIINKLLTALNECTEYVALYFCQVSDFVCFNSWKKVLGGKILRLASSHTGLYILLRIVFLV